MEKKKNLKNKAIRIFFRAGLGLLAVFLVLIIVLSVIINTVVTPEKITPILLNISKEYIHSDVNCESIDITFFSTFPNMGVRLQNGSIASPADTLLTFKNFTVAVAPLAFLFRKQIIIHRLEIKDADVYAHVDTLGHTNWDIFIPADSTETKQDAAAFVIPELDIRDIRLQNINLTYNDLQQDVFIMVDSLSMRLRGNLTQKHAGLNLGLHTTGITSYYQGQTFTSALPFSLRTTLVRDRIRKTLSVEKGTVKVGALKLNTNGLLKRSAVPDIMDVDIDFNLNASSLTDLIEMIPEHLSDKSSKVIAGGKIESNGKLYGQIGKGQYPLITLYLQLLDGTLASAGHPSKTLVEDIDIDFSALLDPSGVQPSSLELKNLYLQTASSKLKAKGGFENIFTQPAINIEANANINFTQMSQKLPLDGMTMEGQIDFDISGQCLLDDILASNYGKIKANGIINIRNVKFDHAEKQFTFYSPNTNITLGTHTRDSIGERIHENLFRGKIVLDTLNLNWKEELIANSSRISILLTTSEPKDSNSIAPVTIGSRINNMRFAMGDYIRIRGVQASGGINIRPRTDMPNLPEISGSISIDSLTGRVYEMAGRISKANLRLKGAKRQVRQRNIQTRHRIPVDSAYLIPPDPATDLSFRIESQEAKDILRNWDISGGFSSNDISIRTPYFPIPIRIRESDMTFTSNILNLTKAHIRLGKTDFTLKGEVEGIRRALMFNGKLSAKMTLDADSLDFNELIHAAAAGSEYTTKNVSEKDSISDIILDEQNVLIPAEDTTALGIFVVPRNLDVEFSSRIRNGKFSDINIRNARGSIILRDQAVQIPRLTLHSDIGSTTITMVYKAPDPKGAHLGMELGVKRVDLKELVNAVPVIAEMAPMLNSFEGVVDCNMTTVTELDSFMNVRLPETTASCYLSGQDLVLLDGETFAEISKKLMFKNKQKNKIDSMSVEIILEDEKLMIFPFRLSMDRYNVAVGGIQNLDMSFDYHITVLKSPIPFKLGLNISGTPENMKIRLGKAKYKDLFTVARQKELDTATINLRVEMDKKLRQSIRDIAGMELTHPIRRPRTEIPDSLKRNLFQLEDTVITNPPDTITIETGTTQQ